MPAPTALKRAEDTPLAIDVPLPTEGISALRPGRSEGWLLTACLDKDEDFLLDAPDALPADSDAFFPEGDEDDSMAIDEEGRPRFAPARDIVR